MECSALAMRLESALRTPGHPLHPLVMGSLHGASGVASVWGCVDSRLRFQGHLVMDDLVIRLLEGSMCCSADPYGIAILCCSADLYGIAILSLSLRPPERCAYQGQRQRLVC